MECFEPREIRLPDGRLQVVRCEKCLACLQHRQAGWITRLRAQLEASEGNAYFVTLTYDEDHLPMNVVPFDYGESKYLDTVPSVRKRDLQSFHMDLRKRFQQGFYYDETLSRNGFGDRVKVSLPPSIIRYYCTAEYGPKGGRPHYHGLYFGLPQDADLTFDLFNALWKRGFTYCEPALSEKAATYVSKYLVNTSLVPISPFADRPWSLMSKGLGLDYLTQARVEWHRAAHLVRSYVPLKSSRQVLPRYLRDRIFDDGMKADILEASLDRQLAKEEYLESLSPDDQSRYEYQVRHDQEEAYRQAKWRFQKSGKIK